MEKDHPPTDKLKPTDVEKPLTLEELVSRITEDNKRPEFWTCPDVGKEIIE